MKNSTIQKVAMVTGATAGFGEAIARKLADEGMRVIITGRRKERLAELAAAIGTDKAFPLTFDVRDADAVDAALKQIPDDFAEIDLLVNNAGLAVGRSTLDNGEIEDWDRMIDTNVKGLLYVTRAVVQGMKRRRSGHIVNIGSIAGKEVYPSGNVYCASKFAVDALTKAMRIDFLPLGIKVTQIAPGAAETEFSMVRYKGDEEKAKKVYEGYQALTADDIADTLWYAVSRPPHVCLNDIVITATAQANSFYIQRS